MLTRGTYACATHTRPWTQLGAGTCDTLRQVHEALRLLRDGWRIALVCRHLGQMNGSVMMQCTLLWRGILAGLSERQCEFALCVRDSESMRPGLQLNRGWRSMQLSSGWRSSSKPSRPGLQNKMMAKHRSVDVMHTVWLLANHVVSRLQPQTQHSMNQATSQRAGFTWAPDAGTGSW